MAKLPYYSRGVHTIWYHGLVGITEGSIHSELMWNSRMILAFNWKISSLRPSLSLYLFWVNLSCNSVWYAGMYVIRHRCLLHVMNDKCNVFWTFYGSLYHSSRCLKVNAFSKNTPSCLGDLLLACSGNKWLISASCFWLKYVMKFKLF